MRSIQIAAPPGPLCDQVEHQIKRLREEHGLDCLLELVNDFEAIVDLGVYAVPGLLIDGELKSVGRVPDLNELLDWLDVTGTHALSGQSE